MAHMKPKGKEGMAQVKRLGRTYKTGGFQKIASAQVAKGKSQASADAIAGAIFQKKVQAHQKGLIHH